MTSQHPEKLVIQNLHVAVEDGTPCSEDLCGAPAFCNAGVCESQEPDYGYWWGDEICNSFTCDPDTGVWTVEPLPDWTP